MYYYIYMFYLQGYNLHSLGASMDTYISLFRFFGWIFEGC
jgi:hypothetical protein